MGSLSDLILYKDEKPNIEETDKLVILLHELFKECELLEYEQPSERIAETFIDKKYHTIAIDVDYTVYRNFEETEVLGNFFWGPNMDDPERIKANIPREMDYAITLPKGTLIRIGFIETREGIVSKGWRQIYVLRPWEIKDLKIEKLK
jgi:hypothetical protein